MPIIYYESYLSLNINTILLLARYDKLRILAICVRLRVCFHGISFRMGISKGHKVAFTQPAGGYR